MRNSKCHNCKGKGKVDGGASKKKLEVLRKSNCFFCGGSGWRSRKSQIDETFFNYLIILFAILILIACIKMLMASQMFQNLLGNTIKDVNLPLFGK